MTDANSNRRKPTTRELVAAKQVKAPTALPPAKKPQTTAVAVPNDRSYRERYLDEVAPASIVGRMIKFSKDGAFITHDDGKEVDEDAEFVVLADQTLVGWIKFNGEGEPPDRNMGLLYENFCMPARETLGDLDETKWEEGLDNQPADPWQHHMYVVLQHTDTAEMYTYVTSSKTGRRAVGNLLRHFDRMQRSHPHEFPVVRLRTGGFQHKDARVGFVNTPVFVVCGRAPKDSTIKPDTSVAAFSDDDIPFDGGGQGA
jgi:hypothetical protein